MFFRITTLFKNLSRRMVSEGRTGKTFSALKSMLRHLFSGRGQETPQPKAPEPATLTSGRLPGSASAVTPPLVNIAPLPPSQPEEAAAAQKARRPGSRQASRSAKKRRAIRRLPSDIDLYEAFGVEVDAVEVVAAEVREKFSQVAEFSLSRAQIGAALQEKGSEGAHWRGGGQKKIVKHRHPRPHVELDLHGCTAAEAERKTTSFIVSSRHRRLKTVRIITGKGLHSDGYAVLPGVVESGLLELKEKKLVLSWHWEGKSRESSGSLIIYLAS